MGAGAGAAAASAESRREASIRRYLVGEAYLPPGNSPGTLGGEGEKPEYRSPAANVGDVKLRLHVWTIAAVPAMLAGHALAYALTGQNLADGHHGYYVGLVLYSTVLAALYGALAVTRALTGAGCVAPVNDSFAATWLKLCLAQVSLFVIAEGLESYVPPLAGFIAQIAVAAIAAAIITIFAQFIERCERSYRDAAPYVRRRLERENGIRIGRLPVGLAFALSVRAGQSRFQRPPPLG